MNTPEWATVAAETDTDFESETNRIINGILYALVKGEWVLIGPVIRGGKKEDGKGGDSSEE
jgi:hypothetical protein